MLKWIREYREANPHTKYFIFNWVLYSLMIIASMLYVYGWATYVRKSPYELKRQIIETKEQKKI